MKSKSYDGADQRRVLTALIVDDKVCSRVASQWNATGLFESKWANIIGKWCIDYQKQYGTAPDTNVKSLFETWATSEAADDKTVAAVETFLGQLSQEHKTLKPQSSEYLLDLAGNYFNKVLYTEEWDAVKDALESGHIEDVERRLADIKRIELGLGSYVSVDNDVEVWRTSFDTQRRRSLVSYPGDLGRFFGDNFQLGRFFSLMAPDKSGKTTWLIDFAYRALRNRNRVAYFECGDGDQEEFIRNMASRATGKPEFTGNYNMPIEWDEETEELIVEEQHLQAVDWTEAYQSFKKVSRREESFRLSCHGNSTISVSDINNKLLEWAERDWRPSVLVIDYADILDAPRGIREKREKVDEIWKQLRRLSQERHCLIMTATQSDSAAYTKGELGLLGPENFSESKTKLAHVNGMIGINVTETEKSQQRCRLNWVRQRHVPNRSRRMTWVHVAGNYDIQSPAIISHRPWSRRSKEESS